MVMAHKACPIPEKTKNLGCRQCPIHDRVEREKICNFYQGQRRAGVPW